MSGYTFAGAVVGREPSSTEWPTFDAPLLRDVTAAFLSRRKALRYRAGLSCHREFTEAADGAWERFNLDLRKGHLRLSVWADGVIWVSVCVRGRARNSGWSFTDGFHGDVRDVSADTLVRMVESTIALRFGVDPPAEREHLRLVWMRVYPRPG